MSSRSIILELKMHPKETTIHRDEILSAQEVAQELRCSKAHIYKLIRGQVGGVSLLPAITLGRRRIVRRAALESWKRINESGSTVERLEASAASLGEA